MAALGSVMQALGGLFKSEAGRKALSQAGEMAIQQAGAQVGGQLVQTVTGAPHALRAKLASIEQFTESPRGWGSTALDDWFPEFRHTIFVAVSGGPTANLKDIWKLALATAFGRFRQRIATFAGASIECIWDITDKSVGVRISYGSNGLIPAALGHLGVNGESAAIVIQNGPSSETVGGNWPGFLQTIPQLYDAAGEARMVGGRFTPNDVRPQEESPTPGDFLRTGGTLVREQAQKLEDLPDDGRIITTAKKLDPNVQPPRPMNGSELAAAISNALSNPCFLPCAPPVGHQIENPEVHRLYPVGQSQQRSIWNRMFDKILGRTRDWIEIAEERPDPPAGLGITNRDGYATASQAVNVVIPNECPTFATLAGSGDLPGNPEDE